MSKHESINYLEFPTRDIKASKTFFSTVFGWVFEDYGPEYAAFFEEQAGMDGGFYQSDLQVDADRGSALVVFYSEVLEKTQTNIESAGGIISKDIFSFPGGRRFHFKDPSGNEFSVWSDKD